MNTTRALFIQAIFSISLAASFGCASNSVSDPEPQQNAGTQAEDEINQGEGSSTNQNDSSTITSCQDFSEESVLKKFGLGFQSGSASLCDEMESKNYKTLIVMITSPTCFSCKPLMKGISQSINGSSDIGFAVAVPNRHNDVESYSMSDVQDMVDESAPGATPAFDEDADLWLSLSKNTSAPEFPLVLIVNKASKAKLFQTERLQEQGILDAEILPAIQELN